MKNYFTFLLCLFQLGLTAQDYYSTSQNLYGNSLRIQLNELISDHQVVSYSNCIAALKETDVDPEDSNLIKLVYKNVAINHNNFAYDINNPDHLDYWNREHVWAKSLGSFGPGGEFENSPAYTDLHNLKPSDMSINYDRGNKGFDTGGAEHTEASGCNFTNESWEPPTNVKGDIARILFYMDIRYNGTNNEPNLTITEELDTYPNPEIGVLSTLLEWHENDPIDEFELNRNNQIYEWQNNRNPFIDHPEYVNRIWGEDSVPITMGTAALIISEYIEGSSNNKALELYNTSIDTIDLSDYKVLKITNGGFWAEQTFNLEGVLPPNSTYVLSHSSALDAINDVSDVQVNLNHNGNDALAISFNDSIIDQIGMEGDAPSGGWEVAGVNTATKDHTIRRKLTITSGNTNWENSAGTNSENSEWIVLEQDDFSGLGSHSQNTGLVTQAIQIPSGWFMVGINVIPTQSSISELFAPLNPELIIIKDFAGNVYFPEFEFNNIADFEIGVGYKLKLSETKLFEIIGTQSQQSVSIPLGWYYFSNLNTEEQDLELFFESYSNEILLIKDYLGNAYLPEYNFNGIGNLIPGMGYQIKTSSPIIINW
jgi:endonuclease I